MDEQAKQSTDALFRSKGKRGGYNLVDPPEPSLEAPVADTHAHLDLLEDVPAVLARCAVHGVAFVCSVADVHEDADKSYECLDAWKADAAKALPQIIANTESLGASGPTPDRLAIPSIRIAIGCHPHNARHYGKDLEDTLVKRLADVRTCALGEVGLDYHYDFSPRDVQREVFRAQIRLAHRCGLPLVLHIREAHDDALSIMEDEGFPEAGTLLHCYNLDQETLEPWLDHDCYVAFGGPLTFKKNEATRQAARRVPITRLLTETDAPFMAPEPMRGMTCGPEHTIFTARRLAEVFGYGPGEQREAFLLQVFENAIGLLDRKPTAWQKQQ